MPYVKGSASKARELKVGLEKAAHELERLLCSLDASNRQLKQYWQDDGVDAGDEVLRQIKRAMTLVKPDLLGLMYCLESYAMFLEQLDCYHTPTAWVSSAGVSPKLRLDILVNFHVDVRDSRSVLEQTVARLGTNAAPKLVDKATLQELARKNKLILYRSVNDNSLTGESKEQIADKQLHENGIAYNGTGGTVHGLGLYFVSNGDYPHDLTQESAADAQKESFAYGSMQIAGTIDPQNARILSEHEAQMLWFDVPEDVKRRFGASNVRSDGEARNAYLAAIGVDAICCKGCAINHMSDYMVVLNRSLLVMCDTPEYREESKASPTLRARRSAGNFFAKIFREGIINS